MHHKIMTSRISVWFLGLRGSAVPHWPELWKTSLTWERRDIPKCLLNASRRSTARLDSLVVRSLNSGSSDPNSSAECRGSIIVWRFKPILSAGLWFHSHLSGGLRLRNYCAVEGNRKFSSRFSVFVCFCGGYSNRVKRLRRLSGNFILLKASLFNKGLPFKAWPSQSGLPSVSPAMWGGVGR